jgi:phosphonate transport system substrate-binding protein
MKKIILLLITVIIVSCSAIPQTEIAGSVDLNDLHPLPTPQGYEAIPLRVAVAAVISPKGTVESYSPFLSYLEEKLNRPIELVQRRTYLEVNDLIEHGEVDIAFVCTSAYIQGHDSFGMELLAAPQVDGKTTYNSYLIVPTSSNAQSMDDLRGKVFAFTLTLSSNLVLPRKDSSRARSIPTATMRPFVRWQAAWQMEPPSTRLCMIMQWRVIHRLRRKSK